MKRVDNVYDQICSLPNLYLADEKAQKGKKKQYGVITHNKNQDANILSLHHMLVKCEYVAGEYRTFPIWEPKERIISVSEYFPHRILQHAILNIVEPYFTSFFTADTYSCIKGKGVHAAVRKLKTTLKDKAATIYFLKLDIKKFYPSVDPVILKHLLWLKFKDRRLLKLFDIIIDSAEGLPIGNFLSQYFANFYLSWFDHWLKEVKKVKHYFRYADDMVILHHDKAYLHDLLAEMREYLSNNLKLTVKGNYAIRPISTGLDFLGYVFWHTHVRLRKTTKKNFARKVARGANQSSIAAYKGLAKYANTKHLLKKLLHETI